MSVLGSPKRCVDRTSQALREHHHAAPHTYLNEIRQPSRPLKWRKKEGAEPLWRRSPDGSVPSRQDYSKAGLTADHAFVAFGCTFEREYFGHRADAGQCAECKRFFRIDRSAGIPSLDRMPAKKQRQRIHGKSIDNADHQHRPIGREATLDGIHGVRARCRRQDGFRTAQPDECCSRVLARAVDVVLGAKLVGERCLVLSAIDGNGFEAELCSVLHPKMAEAPKPQYRCGLTRPDTAVAERVERGNSGTHQRGSVYRG